MSTKDIRRVCIHHKDPITNITTNPIVNWRQSQSDFNNFFFLVFWFFFGMSAPQAEAVLRKRLTYDLNEQMEYVEYFVKWDNVPTADGSWVREQECAPFMALIEKFERDSVPITNQKSEEGVLELEFERKGEKVIRAGDQDDVVGDIIDEYVRDMNTPKKETVSKPKIKRDREDEDFKPHPRQKKAANQDRDPLSAKKAISRSAERSTPTKSKAEFVPQNSNRPPIKKPLLKTVTTSKSTDALQKPARSGDAKGGKTRASPVARAGSLSKERIDKVKANEKMREKDNEAKRKYRTLGNCPSFEKGDTIEKVKGVRKNYGEFEYKIKWQGHDILTWVESREMRQYALEDLVDYYEENVILDSGRNRY